MEKLELFKLELKELLQKHNARIYEESYTDYIFTGDGEEGYEVEEYKVSIDGEVFDLNEVL